MAETFTLDLIGQTQRRIQADLRTLENKIELLRKEQITLRANTVTITQATALFDALIDRIAGFETMIEVRFDKLEARLTGDKP